MYGVYVKCLYKSHFIRLLVYNSKCSALVSKCYSFNKDTFLGRWVTVSPSLGTDFTWTVYLRLIPLTQRIV